MTTADVYNWLFDNTPNGNDVQLKVIWSNMASYCYFINSLDFENIYREELNKLLAVSSRLGINIPDTNHSKVLDIAKHLKSSGSVDEIGEKLHGRDHKYDAQAGTNVVHLPWPA